MTLFILAITFNFLISSFSSILEGLILSVTTAEIEGLKKRQQKKGLLLEKFKQDIEETTSAILTMNTLANTLGAMLIGGLSTSILGADALFTFSCVMTFCILIFAEILPKNIGVLYRANIIEHFVYPLAFLRYLMLPFSVVCKKAIRIFVRDKTILETADKEIILLAEKSAKEGALTANEQTMIANALTLDNIFVSAIMTPRNVVVGCEKSATVGSVLKDNGIILFSRMPLYDKEIDNIVGLIRRRDILKAKANDQENAILSSLQQSILFIPSNVTAADALSQFLKNHQQFAVVVDEFGAVAGVLTLEDIVEHLIGQEIFEKDDLAINMRALARSKKKRLAEDF